MSLVARGLEAAGIPTVSFTAARDITASAWPPRAVYVHTPLGWQVGMPGDRDGQRARLEAVLRAGVDITAAGTIVDLPYGYPTGALDTPAPFDDPELDGWENVEYLPGYRTERTRQATITWPGPRPS